VPLLVDDAKAHALVSALGGRVADQHADLRAIVAALGTAREDRLQKRLDEPLAAVLGTGRDPLDHPEVLGRFRNAGEERQDALLHGADLLDRPFLGDQASRIASSSAVPAAIDGLSYPESPGRRRPSISAIRKPAQWQKLRAWRAPCAR
jgi:hypothetical protein